MTDLGDGQYRLTGGQANLIAGIKSGSKGLDDEEKGEIFVQVLGERAFSARRGGRTHLGTGLHLRPEQHRAGRHQRGRAFRATVAGGSKPRSR